MKKLLEHPNHSVDQPRTDLSAFGASEARVTCGVPHEGAGKSASSSLMPAAISELIPICFGWFFEFAGVELGRG